VLGLGDAEPGLGEPGVIARGAEDPQGLLPELVGFVARSSGLREEGDGRASQLRAELP
jgi:hypothetical protein